ncbi:MAG TPA: hypothetical protein DIC58_08635 [Gammaproteobacteria bacterium]|nr:hypothetical protein [Gammaproteobacteria bacterium]
MPSRRTVIKSLAAAAMPMLAGCALPSAGKRKQARKLYVVWHCAA